MRIWSANQVLPPSIHRSHVINMDFVVAIESHEGSRVAAVLKSGARIVASRPGAARLKARTN
jgi:DNA-binding LytR/AlgR family response regulator